MNDADLKAIDNQISGLGTQVQSITQSCRQLDAGDATYHVCLAAAQQQKSVPFRFIQLNAFYSVVAEHGLSQH